MATIVETSPNVTNIDAQTTTIIETSTVVEVLVITPLPVVIEVAPTQTTLIEVLKGAPGQDGKDGNLLPHVDVTLAGALDGTNNTFTTSTPFVNSGATTILVVYNGMVLSQGFDYVISEGGGAGTGYNTVAITTFIPEPDDRISGTFFTP